MFAVAQPNNRSAGPKNNIMQAQRGFAVRIFKGPTLSSFPYTATAKFDVGYRPTVNSDPRQTQNWYCARPEPVRPSSSNSREPPKPSRFGSWTDNRSRDAPRPAAAPNYADFIYERSLSSKSDVYSNSENDTSSTTTFTPSSTFSPALSVDSTLPSTPSQVPSQSPTTSASTITASPRLPFPLHIPALTQAQSAIRGLFVHPNGDIRQNSSPNSIPAAPVTRPAALPDVAGSPPRFSPPEAPVRPTSPIRAPFSESPHPASLGSSADYFPPPASESEAGEAERLALRNSQYNSGPSSYYPAPRPGDHQQGQAAEGYGNTQGNSGTHSPRGRERSPERVAQIGFSTRSAVSSSFPTESSDQGRGVYESSSIVTDGSTLLNMTTNGLPARPTPVASPPRVAYISSESSSITAVESDDRWRDSFTLNPRSVPVSQLVEIDVPGDREQAARERVLSDPGRYEELRGLNILSDRQRESYANAFAPGTHSRAGQRSSPSMQSEIPTVVRSDDSRGSNRASPEQARTRRLSGNLWSSLPQLPGRRSPTPIPPRPSSTPPLPRIDTSRSSAPPPPPEFRPVESNSWGPQQFPPRREIPAPQLLTAPPVNPTRSRTPVAGPRVLPAEPQRRRSDGDQPMSSSNTLLRRTSAIFHKSAVPVSEPPPPRPSRPGALPLDPQRRRSDGFQSVVPPRPTTPIQSTAAPRNVRWNENLVCPSPIFASQRRKGWYNRRGDQLWTNDGAYKPAPAGQEFPPDLRDYPTYGNGWMNEEGVRIDMGHRLIPKAPLRSALKQTQARGPVIQVEQGN